MVRFQPDGLLPVTPAPVPGEGLLGYVLRMSEANGYMTPWHVLAHAGFSQREMKTAGFPTRKLARVLGRTAFELEGLAYCSDEPDGKRHFKILGHRLGSALTDGALRLDKPAFCPRCVQERGHLEAFWDLTAAVACPIHRCHVLRACPACGRALSWFRPGLLTCRCGANLAEAARNRPMHHWPS